MYYKQNNGGGKRHGTSSISSMNHCRVWLKLDLKGSSKDVVNRASSKGSPNDVDQKLVLIHPSDAREVNIRDGEPALVLHYTPAGCYDALTINNRGALAAAICKVRISSSPLNSPQTRKKKDPGEGVPQGQMHLISPFVLHHLLSESVKEKASIKSETTSSGTKSKMISSSATRLTSSKDVSRTETKVFATPSKSNFSFAKERGGDTLISPPQNYSTPPSAKKSNPTSIINLGVLLVPLRNLNKQQLDGLCCDALELLLCPVNDTSVESKNEKPLEQLRRTFPPLLASRNVIQTLIAAKYHGSYVNARESAENRDSCRSSGAGTQYPFENLEILSIVFRGQMEYFYIMDVMPDGHTARRNNRSYTSQNAIDLLPAIDRLRVSDGRILTDLNDDSLEESEILQKILTNCLHKSCANDATIHVAYKITSQTRIRFISSSELNKNSIIENSTFVNPKLCAGLDTTLSRIRDALLPPILHPNLFPADGPLRPPKGVLLYGPAGVGKSLVAAQFAQDLTIGPFVNNPKGIHVRKVQCADLLASTAIVGEAEKILASIFEEAEREATDSCGSLVILDDVHLICPRRGGVQASINGLGVDQLAGTLLALLDGIGTKRTSNGGVVVLAITTDPSLLTPALRRPGRLDSEIEVPVPDDTTREDILRFHIAHLVSQQESYVQTHQGGPQLIHPNIRIRNSEIEALARLAKGFTGADCKLAIKEAVRNSIRRVHSKQGYDLTERQQNVEGSCCLNIEYSDLEHAIRSTKPSAIKSVAVEVPHVPWSSIGGMENVKSLLRESIELPLTHPHLFEMMQVPPPKGILLYGPPGCSKTLMARAIATEGQMNFLAVKGPELLSKWLGESERALASLFRRARLASPSVIFFDEVDAIASKRGEGGGGGDRLLSQLLTELDGVTSGSDGAGMKKYRVVVVGATNRPDVLDPALTRPGRIDRMIYVGLPDSVGRKSIFEIGLKEKNCHHDVDLSTLASDEVSKGYSGAEIIAICRDAALHAIGEMDDQCITPQIRMKHMLRSINDMKPRTTTEMLRFYETFRGQH